jgi:hypothetical protein
LSRVQPIDHPQQLVVNRQTEAAANPFLVRNAARAADRKTGCEQVANYRIYCLDAANKVASAEWIEAEDDDHAISIVSERHDGYKCEVWDGKRLVARLDLRREA